MAPTRHADEGGQLQLIDAASVDEEEECFESIDKRTSRLLSSRISALLCSARAASCPTTLIDAAATRLPRRVDRFRLLTFRFWVRKFRSERCRFEAKLLRFVLGVGICLFLFGALSWGFGLLLVPQQFPVVLVTNWCWCCIVA